MFNYNDKVYYWTNKSKTKEIDFIYENTALEVKYQNEINSGDYKGLKEFENSYLLTKKTFDKQTYPLSGFLLFLEKYPL